jgi:uncharacterized protein (TIGR03066 family)
MRIAYLVGLFVLGLVLSPAAAEEKKDEKKAKDLIVGKWEQKKEKETLFIEFTKDGKITVKHTKGDQTKEGSGTYKLTDDKIEIEVEAGGEKHTRSGKVKVTKDELTITDDNKTETLKRVK